MKKIIQFSAFLAFLTLFSVNVFAVDYDITISGRQVTDENKDSIAAGVPSVYRGEITYDPENNILTFNNTYIYVTSRTVILNVNIPNLTINLVGENTFIGKTYEPLVVRANTTITGSGSLTLDAQTSSALWHRSGNNLTIDNTTITLIGPAAYNGLNNWGANLVINNSTFRAKATNGERAGISSCQSLTLNGCAIVQPVGAVFIDSLESVCLNGTPLLLQEVLITPAYDLYVAGMQIHKVNKDIIVPALTMSGKTASGVITYDPESKTLTLDEASLDISGAYCIENKMDSLTINLVGENAITSLNFAGIRGQRSGFSITGSGSLTVSGTYGIYLDNCNLDINNTNVTAKGYNTGIRGYNGNNEILTITNSTVIATDSTEEGSIVKLNNIILNGCAIAQPTGAIFDASKRAVCLNNEIAHLDVVIAPFPTISVADAAACDSYTLPTSETTDTWVWTNENNEIVTEATESGVYTVVATSEYDLTATETINVTINPLPTVEIVQEGNILTATAGMATYIWNTNETTESIAISATGNYSVTVTNAAGCESTANIEVTEIPTTGINEMAVPKMAVYPNPNNGNFTINLGDIDNAISYQIVDIKGAIVKEGKINNNKELISIQAKAGNYVVRVITDKNVFVEQIIVQ